MECECKACGYKWVRAEAGLAICCQRCASLWIEQKDLRPIAVNLFARIKSCNFSIPSVLPKIPINSNPAKFDKLILVLEKNAVSLARLLKKIKINSQEIESDIDFEKVKIKNNIEIFNERFIWVHDGKSYQGGSPDDKIFNSGERAVILYEATLLLFYYPEILEDYYLVSVGSRNNFKRVYCFGFWKDKLCLKAINSDQEHSMFIFPSVNTDAF